MAVEAAREFVVDKDKAPEELARFDKVALRPGEGLVDVSEDTDHRVRALGELVVDVSLAAGYIKEVPATAESAEIEELRRLITELEEEKRQHLLTIEELRRERDDLEQKFEYRLQEEIQKVRSEFEEQINAPKGAVAPEEARGAADAEEPTVAKPPSAEAIKEEQIFPGTVIDVESEDKKGWGLTAVSGVWNGPDGQENITYMDGSIARHVPIEKVKIHEEEVVTEQVVPPESATPPRGVVEESEAPLTWRQRAGDWFSLRRPVTYIQTRRPVGGGEVIEEEVTEDRPSPAAYAGGLLVAAALGAFIGWELKNNGHSHTTELINQNKHLKTEVHNMHQTINHDSRIIGQNHDLLKQEKTKLNENNRILRHNRAVLKHLHEQVHHIFKIEKAETGRELSSTSAGGGNAQLSYYGDTVWHETARRMRDASAEKIRKATNYILRINGLRWNGGGAGVDAHKLPVGFRFRIPRNIVEIVNR
jgi:hypothetical protein